MRPPAARPSLPTEVEQQIDAFVSATRSALGDDLSSAVLFGSAAEGRLRATSDVNLILVLRTFAPLKIDAIREPLRIAHAAVRLSPMFLLADEVGPAMEAFALKFADVRRRRVILYGEDPFATVEVSRGAAVRRLRQVLLNLTLRLRQAYALRSLREEQVSRVVADAAGPLRVSAASLLELEGQTAPAPKDALERVAASLPGHGWQETLAQLSRAREEGDLPPGVAPEALIHLIELAGQMRLRAARLV